MATVEINPQREQPGRYPGSGNVQAMKAPSFRTAWEWMEIGGTVETGSIESSGNLGQRNVASSERRSVLLMVQEILR
jgi:hypothetical protein